MKYLHRLANLSWHALTSTACGTPTQRQLRAGVPVHVVSARLGHADPAITLQVYAHVLQGDDHAAAEAAAIFRPGRDPTRALVDHS
jgi:integrase